ncbi:2-phosphosulfolactate phosphatase [Seinonella peptonophila]|uniref:Probable 2-phosphosulfolactate phosphatase n=1 Tax=Seinonella peptonophila TaxID=112248 RepID=A0A1M5ANI3_9BACL|nr:2-phosphosulfolactate phosphatase [Seinonella peptonophila]SHF31667.1 2-phosphosulfolactate phosphatase [Seinonella peptonophila]
MKVSAVPFYQVLDVSMCQDRTVILLDIFRATSFIVTAIWKGCQSVIPVESEITAFELAKPEDLLAGEYMGKPIANFDIDNSPTALLNMKLNEKRIIQSTTNGTRAIQRAQQASSILIGSFLNLQAVVDQARQLENDILLLCAGTRGQFSLEDGLAAGFIIKGLIEGSAKIELDDFAKILLIKASSVQYDWRAWCLEGVAGKRLQSRGKKSDLDYCLRLNDCDIVPQGKWIEIFQKDIKRNICIID